MRIDEIHDARMAPRRRPRRRRLLARRLRPLALIYYANKGFKVLVGVRGAIYEALASRATGVTHIDELSEFAE